MTTEMDVVFSWFSTVPTLVQGMFNRPTRFVQIPSPGPPPQNVNKYDNQLATVAQQQGLTKAPLLALLKTYAPDVRPLRVGLLGFSEGCQGVRALLRSADGRRIDSAIAIDGIHAQFKPGSKTQLEPDYLNAWAAFARLAVDGSRLFVDTTSAIIPPYPTIPTTETSNWIWREATGSTELQTDHVLPEELLQQKFDPPVVLTAGSSGPLVWPTTTYDIAPIYQYRNKGSLWILNYADLDPTGHNDHVFQAHYVLPVVLAVMLAARWNQIAPDAGICVLADGPDDTADPYGGQKPVGCYPPTRLTDLYLQGGGEPAPLDIDPNADPSVPTEGAHPPDPGTPIPPLEEPPPAEDTTTHVLKWVGGILASALVLEGARRAGTYLKEHKPKAFT